MLAWLSTLACGGFSAASAAAVPVADDTDAAVIVQKADEVRFPSDAFEAGVTIETASSNGAADTRKYRILSKGNENTIVMVTEPAAERGQIMLMKGHDLWVFLPRVSQPVRLSLSQRLVGQVANGDLARANFAGDYDAKLLRSEVVDGANMYVLELTARERNVTYQKVLYWVRKGDYWPHKAEFYSLSDRLLKTALYDEFKRIAGRLRPTRIIMQDALRKDEHSTLLYTDMQPRELTDRMFTKDYLKRLE
ncbi:MAG: outer membrane lipoprotein-sorting protein [Casimicrobiaceae bacterium]